MNSRFCVKCGKPGPFRNERAIRCENCDETRVQERRNYHARYHRARQTALARLAEAHRKEFTRLFNEEKAKTKLEMEEGEE